MNREIKCRGKRLDNGEWVDGGLITDNQGNYGIAGLVVLNNCNTATVKLVDPATVGQFSGMHIVKERELYEGDVVFSEEEHDHGDERCYYVCVWVCEWACICLFSLYEYRDYLDDGILPTDDSVSNTFIMSQRDCSTLHYAGNVYDNPELLKQQTNENNQ